MTRTFSMALAATAIALTPACAQGQVDPADKKAVEKIVYEYIMENPEIPGSLGVQSIPYFVVYKNGEKVAEQMGAAPKSALKGWIESVI